VEGGADAGAEEDNGSSGDGHDGITFSINVARLLSVTRQLESAEEALLYLRGKLPLELWSMTPEASWYELEMTSGAVTGEVGLPLSHHNMNAS
jgi:hypothetical protein